MKAGRKPKYGPEKVEVLRDMLSQGHHIKTCCRAAGISEKTWGDWMKNKPDFKSKMFEAVTVAEREALDRILAAGKRGDWRADAFFLQHRFSERWSQKLQVDFTHDYRAEVENMTDEELMDLLQEAAGESTTEFFERRIKHGRCKH